MSLATFICASSFSPCLLLAFEQEEGEKIISLAAKPRHGKLGMSSWPKRKAGTYPGRACTQNDMCAKEHKGWIKIPRTLSGLSMFIDALDTTRLGKIQKGYTSFCTDDKSKGTLWNCFFVPCDALVKGKLHCRQLAQLKTIVCGKLRRNLSGTNSYSSFGLNVRIVCAEVARKQCKGF